MRYISCKTFNLLLAGTLLLPLTACGSQQPAADTDPGPAPAATGNEAADDGAVADALLGLEVRGRLLDRLGWDGLRVGVEVSGDAVTLDGEVRERSTQELAEEVALSVDGVHSVDNRLTVRSAEADEETPVGDAVADAELEVQDAALEVRVKANLFKEIGRHAREVEVEATDGEVSLRGRLPDEARKRLALEAARGTKGVVEVIDLLEP